MSSITPFKIAIPEERLQRLKQKLSLSNFPDEIIDTEDRWARGPPLSEIECLAIYWQNSFDWRKAEAQLNTLPQYKSKISVENFGIYDIHFVHQTSIVPNAVPLLFVHGWPGSFIEVSKILPELVRGGKDGPAFHVVAPSLVDFGFSSGSKKKPFNIDQHAEVCHKLMLSLGYKEYGKSTPSPVQTPLILSTVTQGGDLGYLITRFISLKYGPAHCKAQHLNNTAPAEPTSSTHPELHAKFKDNPLTPSDMDGLARTQAFSTSGNGYMRLLSTKPVTISYSLTDSPIGLLAFLYEKLHDWADAYPWTNDEILTWISIYYFSTAGPGAAGNTYYEMEHRKPIGPFEAAQEYSDVPLGVSRFVKDLILLPKAWNATLGKVVFESEHEKGGHFAAWERPDALVGDLRRMFGRDGGAFGCVEGASGYKD